jgi:putative two-component system response regulator
MVWFARFRPPPGARRRDHEHTMASHSTILIVDDNESIRDLLAATLTHAEYQIITAASGEEALALADRYQPDLVLLDVMMPGMDGYEVCRRLRAAERTAEVPILMITALDDRASRMSGIEAGADDFLTKPMDRTELRARVRTITRLDRYRRLHDERSRRELALREAAEQLTYAYDATLEGWARALDLRDHETEGHSRRVTELTVRLAERLGIAGEALQQIRRGALLHDIGKIGIPDAILLKPGKLDPGEWEVMKRHPLYGRDLLAPIAFLHSALDIPYCHHERWDGTGYPQGLAGEAIPLAARIFAVVDVWDAITSDRPYHKAAPAEEALHYIRSQAGRHFDPAVVAAFEAMIAEGHPRSCEA